jgi:hypothetical protein
VPRVLGPKDDRVGWSVGLALEDGSADSEGVGIVDGPGVGAMEGCVVYSADGWVVGMMYVQ